MDNEYTKLSEPFAATKIWNELVSCFKDAISLKSHRRLFKKHRESFTASEAISVMHHILKTDVNPEATRHQALIMMKKFLLLNVIEDIEGVSGSENISDNSSLFRLICDEEYATPPIVRRRRASMMRNPAFRNVLERSMCLKSKVLSPDVKKQCFSPSISVRRFSISIYKKGTLL